jgi:hypothetical protein
VITKYSYVKYNPGISRSQRNGSIAIWQHESSSYESYHSLFYTVQITVYEQIRRTTRRLSTTLTLSLAAHHALHWQSIMKMPETDDTKTH